MTITKICKHIERETGIKGTYTMGANDLHLIEYNCDNWTEYENILNTVYRMKNAVIAYKHLDCKYIQVAERSEYERFEEWNNARNALVEGFWQAYHIGGDSAADAYYAENLDKYHEYDIV